MASRAHNLLALFETIRLHPDPWGPILLTRTGRNAMGPGHYRTTADKTAGSGRGSGGFTSKTIACAECYRTTAVFALSRLCARARLRPPVMLSLSFSGSGVVDRVKALILKGKGHYLGHYRATTPTGLAGSSTINPLKSFEKGGI